MELRQLRYFSILANTLNFSQAAKHLYITQGTLSQQIKQLEEELDTELFVRSSHMVELTESGLELLAYVNKIIEDAEICKTRAQDLKTELSGTLIIGVTSSFSPLLTNTMTTFLKAHPKVQIKVYYKTAVELLDMLHQREIDCMLAFQPVAVYPKVESELLFTSQLMAVVRKEHPLAKSKKITLKELSMQDIALPGSGLQTRKAFERFVDVDTSSLRIRVELNDPMLLLDMVKSTNLVTIVSNLAVYYRPSLVAIPIDGIQREMRGCVHTLRDSYRKRTTAAFIEMLHQTVSIIKIDF